MMNPAKRICMRPTVRSFCSADRLSAPRTAPLRAFCAPAAARPSFSRPRHWLSPSFPSHRLQRSPLSSAVTAPPEEPEASEPERKPWRAAPHRRPEEPVYELYFTCKVCEHRSGHSISKQAYHNGTTLVKCPGCANRHLISDHLKIFSDESVTLEDILREKGQSLQMGSIDGDGDIEFWDKDSAERSEQSNTKPE